MIVPALLTGCAPNGTSTAGAEYPTQSVRVVVPFAAGGPTDLMARSLAKCLEEDFKETVIVENQDGGSGAVAMSGLASAKADGHTMALTTTPPAALTPLQVEGAGYTKDSFAAIAVVAESPSAVLVAGDSAYKDIDDLLADAKANPGDVSIATPGANSVYSLVLEELKEQSGLQFEVIPYDGTASAIPALLGGHVDAMFTDAAKTQIDLVEAGDARIISSGADREYLPDAPSLEEASGEKLPSSTQEWFVTVPKDTPSDVQDSLESVTESCLQDPEFVKQVGEEYIPDPFLGAEEARNHLDDAAAAFEAALG